ncbi:MAG: hypothetical protein ABF723_04055 [Lentilactobacillus hilgardii]|uniref:hypothetical protein n=1 Tax=Lactobacillaceae TaxID=33958 RepID=UPI001CC20405|nr:hypothetical protein [Lentilactobacillus hilgardii]MBZ2200233.1 hypothetical protein [Lentilactobacillus hilgardii]MBZ2203357.1 hypothetical protein [Lentilactobacillus hilgardii]
MEKYDRALVIEYLTLDKKINRAYDRMERVRAAFYTSHSFVGSVALDENGNRVRQPSAYTLVNQLIDNELSEDRCIAVNQFKLKHFKRYFNQLSNLDREYLIRRFLLNQGMNNELLDKKTLNECECIQEATAWYFGFEQEVHLEFADNVNDNLQEMLAMLS